MAVMRQIKNDSELIFRGALLPTMEDKMTLGRVPLVDVSWRGRQVTVNEETSLRKRPRMFERHTGCLAKVFHDAIVVEAAYVPRYITRPMTTVSNRTRPMSTVLIQRQHEKGHLAHTNHAGPHCVTVPTSCQPNPAYEI